ncbi:hypothetical protein OAG24_00315 [bacterium]|nr:hypothetical protein [bacterium]
MTAILKAQHIVNMSAILIAQDILKINYTTIECSNFTYKGNNITFTLRCKICNKTEPNLKYGSFCRRKTKCLSCERIAAKRHGGKPMIFFEDFLNLLGSEGWEFFDEPENFKNASSVVKVVSPLGEITRTSYSKFKLGVRSRTEHTLRSRANFEEIKKTFEEKGYLLKIEENEYKNNITPLYCMCINCGSFQTATYKAIKHFSKKCKECGIKGGNKEKCVTKNNQ